MEYFVVAARGKRQGLPYSVLRGFDFQGTFQNGELSKVTITDDTVYLIEKVLRKRKGKVYVKWMGWPDKFNLWIP